MKKYSERFLTRDSVLNYEDEEYAVKGYSSAMWELQKPFIRKILEAKNGTGDGYRLLDFACGTGRVLSYMEKFTRESDGVDISEAMVARAGSRCPKSRLVVGALCAEEILLEKPYELVTCFRFLLNAEPGLRAAVLEQLRKRIDSEKGIFMVNVHGNRRSSRYFSLLLRRMRAKINPAKHKDVMMGELSLDDTRELLAEAGFAVIREIGFGVLPSFLYRGFLRSLVSAIDRRLCGSGLLKGISIDVVFVCVPVRAA